MGKDSIERMGQFGKVKWGWLIESRGRAGRIENSILVGNEGRNKKGISSGGNSCFFEVVAPVSRKVRLVFPSKTDRSTNPPPLRFFDASSPLFEIRRVAQLHFKWTVGSSTISSYPLVSRSILFRGSLNGLSEIRRFVE